MSEWKCNSCGERFDEPYETVYETGNYQAFYEAGVCVKTFIETEAIYFCPFCHSEDLDDSPDEEVIKVTEPIDLIEMIRKIGDPRGLLPRSP